LHPNGVASLECEGSGWRYRITLHRGLLRCLHPNGVASLECEGSGWRYRITLHRELLRDLHPDGIASLVYEGSGWWHHISRSLDRSRHGICRHIRSLRNVVLPLVGRSRLVRGVIRASVVNLQGDMSPRSGTQQLITHDLVTRLLVVAVRCLIHRRRVDVGISVLSVVVQWVQYAVVMVAV
jgi:uncharacterized membrane protein (UPF0136 family)